MKQNGNKECPYLFEMVAGSLCNEPFSKELFDSYIDMKFENRTYMSVKNYDEYLSATFGEYMKLPRVEKRVRHHHFIAYWKD